MTPVVAELKTVVHEVLGGIASNTLLIKIDAALNEGSSTDDALVQACSRIEKMANLFIGTDKAQAIAKRFRETLSRAGIKNA